MAMYQHDAHAPDALIHDDATNSWSLRPDCTPAPESWFAVGTMISTSIGEQPVDRLCPGDRVLTRDNGYQPVIWTGRFDLAPCGDVMAVTFAKNAFGPGLPSRPLCLAPDHRVLLAGSGLGLHFGAVEMLVAARHLAGPVALTPPPHRRRMTLHHLLLPDHEVILAEGLWVESLFARSAVIRLQPEPVRRMIERETAGRHLQTARACLTSRDVAALSRAFCESGERTAMGCGVFAA